LQVSFTLGGTAGTTVYITPPVPFVSSGAPTWFLNALTWTSAAGWNAALGVINTSSASFQVSPFAQANYSLTTYNIGLSGHYRAA
ncbi:MAG: hypothetical protein WAM39_13630, partial [Bryobacteraceae bacterium]